MEEEKEEEGEREDGRRAPSFTYEEMCVFVCTRGACAWAPVKRGWGPRLLMYLHIMLGSDPAAVSKMFEAQNTIFEKCSHRLAILFLQRPDIWPLSFSPAYTYTPSSQLAVWGGITVINVELLHVSCCVKLSQFQ